MCACEARLLCFLILDPYLMRMKGAGMKRLSPRRKNPVSNQNLSRQLTQWEDVPADASQERGRSSDAEVVVRGRREEGEGGTESRPHEIVACQDRGGVLWAAHKYGSVS